MNLDNLNNLSPAEVARIKENGGFSGSVSGGIDYGTGPDVFEPKTSVKISGYGRDLRPRMSTHGDTLISGPSADLPKKLAQQAEQQLKERKAATKQDREDPLSNHNLRKDLEITRRRLAKLEKQLNEIKKEEKA